MYLGPTEISKIRVKAMHVSGDAIDLWFHTQWVVLMDYVLPHEPNPIVFTVVCPVANIDEFVYGNKHPHPACGVQMKVDDCDDFRIGTKKFLEITHPIVVKTVACKLLL